MTRDEFIAGPATILDGAFPGEFTPGDERAYLFMLRELPVEAVMAVLADWAKDWRPSAGELKRRARLRCYREADGWRLRPAFPSLALPSGNE